MECEVFSARSPPACWPARLFAVMFFMGGMGGGDVKLMAAIAAFAGLAHLPELLLATALAGGVFAVAVAIARGALGDTLRSLFGWLAASTTRRERFLPTCPPVPALRSANCGGRTAHFL